MKPLRLGQDGQMVLISLFVGGSLTQHHCYFATPYIHMDLRLTTFLLLYFSTSLPYIAIQRPYYLGNIYRRHFNPSYLGCFSVDFKKQGVFRKLLSISFHMPPSALFYLFSFRNGKQLRKTIRIRRQEKWNHVLGFMTAGHFPLRFGLHFFGHFALFFLFFIDIIFLLCLDSLLVNVRPSWS